MIKFFILIKIILSTKIVYSQNTECIPLNIILGIDKSYNCCNHAKITCLDGHVRRIDFSQSNLNGTIPNEIGNLVYLEDLVLLQNNFSGPIPPEIGKLTNLKILNIRNNKFSGSLPSELGNLTKLTYMSISFNELSGPIPSSFGNLQSLQKLYIRYNFLSGSLPSELGNLSNLLDSTLTDNHLTGEIPEEIGNLPKLTLFDLSNNDFCGPRPSSSKIKVDNNSNIGVPCNGVSNTISSGNTRASSTSSFSNTPTSSPTIINPPGGEGNSFLKISLIIAGIVGIGVIAGIAFFVTSKRKSTNHNNGGNTNIVDSIRNTIDINDSLDRNGSNVIIESRIININDNPVNTSDITNNAPLTNISPIVNTSPIVNNINTSSYSSNEVSNYNPTAQQIFNPSTRQVFNADIDITDNNLNINNQQVEELPPPAYVEVIGENRSNIESPTTVQRRTNGYYHSEKTRTFDLPPETNNANNNQVE
jgi:hypothetical protein